MKVSKDQAKANKALLLEAGSRLFRERGIDGVGIAEISKQAGLTHGALYAHFPTKQALAAEALSYGLHASFSTFKKEGETLGTDEILDAYLCSINWADAASGCALTASASEIARQDENVSQCFGQGFEELAGMIEEGLPSSLGERRRPQAILITSALIGGVAAARGALKSNPALSREILGSLRQRLGEYSSTEG